MIASFEKHALEVNRRRCFSVPCHQHTYFWGRNIIIIISIQCRAFKFRFFQIHRTECRHTKGLLTDKLTWNICRSSSATRLRRRIVAMVTAMVCDGSAGGGEAELLGGAPWCNSMPYSMDTAPTSSVTWRVPISWVGSSLLSRRRALPLHLHRTRTASWELQVMLNEAPRPDDVSVMLN